MGIRERKEREKARRRQDILNQAALLIQQKSYQEITMEDIARELELSRATLYLYFSNKSEIYTTLLTEGMLVLRSAYDEWEKKNPDRPPIERLFAIARIFFEFYAKNSSYFDLMFSKREDMLRAVTSETYQEHKKSGQAILDPLMRALEEGIENGQFKRRKPEKLGYLLRAIVIGIAIGFKEGKLSYPEDVPLLEEFILPGLLQTTP